MATTAKKTTPAAKKTAKVIGVKRFVNQVPPGGMTKTPKVGDEVKVLTPPVGSPSKETLVGKRGKVVRVYEVQPCNRHYFDDDTHAVQVAVDKATEDDGNRHYWRACQLQEARG